LGVFVGKAGANKPLKKKKKKKKLLNIPDNG
jgi:hypothetical protein